MHSSRLEFVSDGLAKRPWEELKGQIYLGSEEFIERHSAADKELKEIPRAQLRAVKPTLDRIFAKSKEAGIARAYREHGYRLHEIAKHLEALRDGEPQAQTAREFELGYWWK